MSTDLPEAELYQMQLNEVERQIDDARSKIQDLTETLKSLRNQQEAIREALYESQNPDVMSLDEFKRFLRVAADSLSMHKKLEEYMIRRFGKEIFYPTGTHQNSDGTWGAPALSVKLDYRQKVAGKQLRKFMSYVSFLQDVMDNMQDEISFGIFEHTLSEYGVYRLVYSPKTDTAKILLTFYGSTHELHGDMPLRQALELVAEKYWYEGGPDDN